MIISLFIAISIKENLGFYGTEVTLFNNKLNLSRPLFALGILRALSLFAFSRFIAFALAAHACPNATKLLHKNEDGVN